MPQSWTRAVLRLRIPILACWLVLLTGGTVAATHLSPLLWNSFAVPASDSERAQSILAKHFGERTDGTFTVVFPVAHPSNPGLRHRLQHRLALAARTIPTGRARALRAGGGLLYGDIDTGLALRRARSYTGTLRAALRTPGGPPALVTGQPAIQYDLDPVLKADLRRAEEIALPAALLVLLAALGLSLAVAIPFVLAASTIATTFAVIYGFAQLFPVVTYVTNLVELIGLGLAIDYSLLIVQRFREELGRGCQTEQAIVRTMATAGRAVVCSGLTVAAGLGLLLLIPVPFVRSLGLAGVLIPLVAIAASLTLQPAILSLLGSRTASSFVVRPRRRARSAASGPERGAWARLAGWIVRRPGRVFACCLALLLVASVPAARLRLTPGSLAGIPASLESSRAATLLANGVGPGAVTPIQVAVDSGRAGVARAAPVHAAVERLADLAFHDPEALLVAIGEKAPYVDASGRYARMIVAARHEYGAVETRQLVERLRSRLVPAAHFPAGTRVLTGGVPAQGADFVAKSYGNLPWLVLAVLVVTFLLLMRAFRSLVLPLKAILLNLVTTAAVYGLLVLVFRYGVGADLLGLYRMPQIDAWVPIFLFVLLFGLSTDYEVFVVSRVREAWDEVPDNNRAVAVGLERTGRIVTAGALIMIAAFSGFAAGRVAGLQELGLGLALAILIDATIVRALLVPAFIVLVGRYNWWLPGRVARLARLEHSPLAEPPGPGRELTAPVAGTAAKR